MSIDIQRHDTEGLAAIAERFLPLFSSMLRHFALAGVGITRSPPGAGRRAVQIVPSQVEATDFVHARGQPEKAFCSKDRLRLLLQEVPEPLRVKWPPGGVTNRGNATAQRDAALVVIE
jgi:hypothetical protein